MKKVLHLTGLTKQEFGEQLKIVEEGGDVEKRCYVCKRKAGEDSVALNISKKEPYFSLPKVKLADVQRDVEEFVFQYSLCEECLLLIEGAGVL